MTNEGVEVLLLEEQGHATIHLVGVVLARHTLIGLGIVGLANAGHEHQVHVVELVRRQDHQVCWLEHFFLLDGVEIGHACGCLAVGCSFHAQHFGVRAVAEVLLALQCIQHCRLWR